MGANLAEGLKAIHRRELIHRDLKPGNVIMADNGPRIIDFGIARVVNASTLTHAGTVLGTYGYMAPEQITADEANTASDVFALGCVLVFAATGTGPFDASTVPAVVHRVLTETPQLDGVPSELRDLIEACVAKDPDDRPTTEDLLDQLASEGMAPTKIDPLPGNQRSGNREAGAFVAGHVRVTTSDTVKQDGHQPPAPKAPAPRVLSGGVPTSTDASEFAVKSGSSIHPAFIYLATGFLAVSGGLLLLVPSLRSEFLETTEPVSIDRVLPIALLLLAIGIGGIVMTAKGALKDPKISIRVDAAGISTQGKRRYLFKWDDVRDAVMHDDTLFLVIPSMSESEANETSVDLANSMSNRRNEVAICDLDHLTTDRKPFLDAIEHHSGRRFFTA